MALQRTICANFLTKRLPSIITLGSRSDCESGLLHSRCGFGASEDHRRTALEIVPDYGQSRACSFVLQIISGKRPCIHRSEVPPNLQCVHEMCTKYTQKGRKKRLFSTFFDDFYPCLRTSRRPFSIVLPTRKASFPQIGMESGSLSYRTPTNVWASRPTFQLSPAPLFTNHYSLLHGSLSTDHCPLTTVPCPCRGPRRQVLVAGVADRCYPCCNAIFRDHNPDPDAPSPAIRALHAGHLAALRGHLHRRAVRLALLASAHGRRRRLPCPGRPAHGRDRQPDHLLHQRHPLHREAPPALLAGRRNLQDLRRKRLCHPPAQHPGHARPHLAGVALGAPRLGTPRRPLCRPRRAYLHRTVPLHTLHHSRGGARLLSAPCPLLPHHRPGVRPP